MTDLDSQTRNLLELLEIAEASGLDRLTSRINDETDKLKQRRFHLVVLGQFKRGKTTFINALLGTELLPVGVIPVTSVITLIHFSGTQRIEVVFDRNRRLEIDKAHLREYITEKGNPRNEKGVRYVEIGYPAKFLEGGIVLVDTPGVGSVFLHNTETAREYIPNVDAAIFVLSADPPITLSEFEFLNVVAEQVEKIYFLFNKKDLLTAAEHEEAIRYAREIVAAQLGDGECVMLPISARQALQARMRGDKQGLFESGINEVEQQLRSFLEKEKLTVLIRRSEKRVGMLLAELRYALELELTTLQTPLDELEKKVEIFQNELSLLAKEREQFAYIIKGSLQTLEKTIDEALENFSRHEIDQLDHKLRRWANEDTTSHPDEFAKHLENSFWSEFTSDLTQWRKTYEPQLVGAYHAILLEGVDRTNRFIEKLSNLSSQVFEVSLQKGLEVEPLAWKGTFYYKLEEDPLFLQVDFLRIFSALLPSSFVRKRLLNRITRRTQERVNSHCGRLRYEYVSTLEEHSRIFSSELEERIDQLMESIRRVLRKATERSERDKSSTSGRLTAIRGQLDRLRTISHQQEILS